MGLGDRGMAASEKKGPQGPDGAGQVVGPLPLWEASPDRCVSSPCPDTGQPR